MVSADRVGGLAEPLPDRAHHGVDHTGRAGSGGPGAAEGEGGPHREAARALTIDKIKEQLSNPARLLDSVSLVEEIHRQVSTLRPAGGGGQAAAPIVIMGDVTGDVVGRDSFVGRRGGGVDTAEPVARRVAAPVLAGFRGAFVEPGSAGAIRDRLARPGLVLLAGPRGWGKTALGMVLLAERCQGEVYEFEPIEDLLRLPTGALKAGRGYLVTDLPPHVLTAARGADLHRLDEEVTARGARLVLTVAGAGAAAKPCQLPVADHPEPKALLLAHLGRLLAAERVAELTGQHAVAELIEGSCQEPFEAAALVRLAEELARLDRGAEVTELAQRLTVRSKEELRAWLDEVSSPDRAFLLCVAMFDGLAYGTVVDLAERLDRLTTGRAAARVDGPPHGRQARCERTRTEILRAWSHTPYGRVPTEIVRLRQADHRPWIVDQLWCAGYYGRPALLRWLRELGTHHARPVRGGAGAAVGLLMSREFETFRRAVLEPWAAGEDPAGREAALVALGVAAGDFQLTGAVVRLAHSWSRSGEWQLRRTAARAFGESLGHLVPDTAFEVLGELAGQSDPGGVFAISQSLVELARSADDALLATVVATVESWATSHRAHRRHVGVYGFLQLCADLCRPGEHSAPRLLQWADQGAEPTMALAGLWRRALIDPLVNRPARWVLRWWAQSCEGDTAATTALARLARSVARLPREVEILRRAALTWPDADPPATAAAAAVLDALSSPVRGARP
ncbi:MULTISPECIES: hypothetical protein [unclassified Crossiella]|uniref:hypothetical protein n=1 Tax=unclassified Crossiella TaxID=2620835 RepID=UPI001FFF34CE|nr:MULTISPECIES: hypothetical protein [unclassified Crossiella]MCK2240836.1 hypothetical protein [Crossiella sp. S99.2]MCK2254020.1 hypothetical protein [Crossiella sp. S99.1]